VAFCPSVAANLGHLLHLHNARFRNAAMQHPHGWKSRICHVSQRLCRIFEHLVNALLPFA
jgi:hypothetical protein